jgi:hypothetical protein
MVTPSDRLDEFEGFEPFDASGEGEPSRGPRRPYRPRGSDMSASTVTAQGRAANRANAEISTGPRTAQGKARAARNSTSHGIFCRELLLPHEDQPLLRRIRESFIHRLRPQDALELLLVDRIVQAQWRLNRCQGAERLMHEEHASAGLRGADAELEDLRRTYQVTTRADLAAPKHKRRADWLGEKFDRIEAAQARARECGYTLMLGMQSSSDPGLVRLGGYEQRLERSIHHALRELRLLRGTDPKTWEELPESPYAGVAVERDDDGGNSAEQLGRDAQATNRGAAAPSLTPSPGTPGEGWGEGSAQGRSPADLPSTAPDPHPALSRSTGEREQECRPVAASASEEQGVFAPAKNEPVSAATHLTASTGENSLVEPVGEVAVATSAVPDGSSATGSENDATPDALVVTETEPTNVLPPPENSST